MNTVSKLLVEPEIQKDRLWLITAAATLVMGVVLFLTWGWSPYSMEPRITALEERVNELENQSRNSRN